MEGYENLIRGYSRFGPAIILGNSHGILDVKVLMTNFEFLAENFTEFP
jgi:hypothetical protein